MGVDAHNSDDDDPSPEVRYSRAVTRELSFSNGIASAAPRIIEDDSTSESDLLEGAAGDNSFTFGSSSSFEDSSSEAVSESWGSKSRVGDRKQAVADGSPEHGFFDDYELVVQIPVSDKEFERNFGDSAGPMLKTILRTLSYVLVWYTFSTCLTLYNKLLLGQKYGKFPAPLMMNTIHFSMQALVSTFILRFCCPTLKPAKPMSWKDYFVRVIPTGLATALDVDFTNASLVFISVTFATMCKSATPVFLLFFAFLFKLESPSFRLFGIMVIISLSVLLTVAKETEFNLLGFILVMFAALSSGFRWVVTQLLLQKEEYGLSNPLAAMSYFTPVMAVITAVFSFILEPWNKLAETPYFNTKSHTLESCLLMLLGGSLAFFMVMAEYLLILKTSAVTMTVAGVVKEVVTIVVAILYFGDQFTVLKAIGLLIIMVGVGLFNWFKYKSLTEHKAKLHELEGIQINSMPAVKYSILGDETSLQKL